MSTDQRKNRKLKWVLYVLKCRDNTWYTGITTDLARRVWEHNAGRASRYTRARLPVTVIYLERCSGLSSALKKEYDIKRLSRKEKAEYINAQCRTINSKSAAIRSGSLGRSGKDVRKTIL